MRNLTPTASLIFLFVLGLGGNLLAQNFQIKGQLHEVDRLAPIAGAFICTDNGVKGTYSDESGRFTLRVDQKTSATIVIKRLGFQSKRVELAPDSDSLYQIVLIADSISLPTQVITAKNWQRVHPNPALSILDYGFIEDNFLLIVYDAEVRRNKLVLLDPQLKLLSEHYGYDQAPKKLERDCLGAYHYISRDHACQIDLVDGKLTVYQEARSSFETVLQPCLGQIDGRYYFEDKVGKYESLYYFIDQRRRRKEVFYGSRDTVSLTTLADEALMPGRYSGPGLFNDPGPRGRFYRNLGAKYLEFVQCPQQYSPLFLLGGIPTIFDHNRKKILRFDADSKLTHTASIEYMDARFWERKILSDHESERAFALFNWHGNRKMSEIDLQNGNLLESWELPKKFVTNVQVKGNVIYFLYRDPDHNDINQLYAFYM